MRTPDHVSPFSGKQIGEFIEKGNIPKEYQRFGNTKEDIFADLKQLKLIYGDKAEEIPTGALGVYSYINRLSTGLHQFLALNRKFDLTYIDRNDIIPMTELASKVSGLSTYMDLMNNELVNI